MFLIFLSYLLLFFDTLEAQDLDYRVRQLENRLSQVEQKLSNCQCSDIGGGNFGGGNSQCPPGWELHNQFCWMYHPEQKSWRDARETCMAYGGDLASITSDQENQHAYQMRRRKLKNSHKSSNKRLKRQVVSNPETCFIKYPQSVLYQQSGQDQQYVVSNSPVDCMYSCLQSQELYRFECKSIMFYPESSNCILNTEDHKTGQLQDLTSSSYSTYYTYKVDYYANTCENLSQPQPSAAEGNWPFGGLSDEACFIKTPSSSLMSAEKMTAGLADKIISGISLDDCMHSCKVAEIELKMVCNSFVYYSGGRDCIMNMGTKDQAGVTLIQDFDADYYENLCNKNKQCFAEFQGKSLIGYADASVQTSSSDECMKFCIQQWWLCSSIVYYPKYNDCIMNAETQFTKPDNFASAQQEETVTYYDRISCNGHMSCQGNIVDLMFVVDGSGSIGMYNFEKIKNFVKEMIDSTEVGFSRTHVGMVQFTHEAKTEFSLNSYSTNQNLKNAIDRMQMEPFGHTDMTRALQYTLDYELNPGKGDRPDVKTVLILLTDGFNTVPSNSPRIPAQMMRDNGVITYAVGVTSATNLLDIAGAPERAFMLDNFDQLEALKDNIMGQICSDSADKGLWIGLTDSDNEGSFKWSDGSVYSFNGWDNTPSDNQHNKNCVLMKDNPAGSWGDSDCTTSHSFLCKMWAY